MNTAAPQFITIDGIDGAGKSTQIEQLSRFLNDRELRHLTVRDPGSSEIGDRLRSLLLDSRLTMHPRTEAMLFMASRCEMVETTIRPALAGGTTVVSDRFLLANVVYQSVAGDHESVPPKWLWQLGEMANGGVRPDLTILMDLPAETALDRLERQADRMESRGLDYMNAVRQAYLEQLPRSSAAVAVVDALQPPETIAEEIRRIVGQHFDRLVSR